MDMIKLRFEINSLPSLNEYIYLERTESKNGRKNVGRNAAAGLKKKLTNLVQLMALNQIRTQYTDYSFPIQSQQNAFFIWETEDNRQDPDNVFFAKKFIFDGLHKAKILSGDGRKQINHCFDFIQTTEKKAATIYLIDSFSLQTNRELFEFCFRKVSENQF